jgi:hypothetical protein
MTLIKKFFTYLQTHSLRSTMARSLRTAIFFIKKYLGLKDPISRRIEYLDKVNAKAFNYQVKYGPFSGLKFSKDSWWGLSTTHLIGIYEKEILDSLIESSGQYGNFINIGAADGYYAIGVLVNNTFNKSYCYEISSKGRKMILDNAKLNNVSDRVVINAEAKSDFYNDFSENELKDSVLFVDIEGAEFDFFTNKVLTAFANSLIYIEIHDWFFEDGEKKYKDLLTICKNLFKVTFFTTTSRDISVFPEFNEYNDNDRWLLCSEGRERLMTWIKLEPKDN